MDRALNDADWLRQRLEQVQQGVDQRTRDWAAAALERAGLEVRWTTTLSGTEARDLELKVLTAFSEVDLWNRARPVSEVD